MTHDDAEQVRRFLDPYDDITALLGDGDAVLNISQLVERMRFGLERIELDPTAPCGLDDITDPDSLTLAAQAGMGPMLAAVFTDLAVEAIERTRPWAIGNISPERLDPNLYGFTVSPTDLAAAKALLRHRLTHRSLSVGDVEAEEAARPLPGLVAILASVLTFYVLVLTLKRPE